MIFTEEHIEKILRGEKTQTRRESPRYQVGHVYAVQPGRGKKAVARIKILSKWGEPRFVPDFYLCGFPSRGRFVRNHISEEDAKAEGGYTPEEYEALYERMHPHWNYRWAYEFRLEEAETQIC